MTTRGFGEDEFAQVVEMMDRVSPRVVATTPSSGRFAAEVHELCSRFPLYDFVVA
jgi:glycine hydroxymethyltransferase